jgi:hypothetical protein
MSRASIVLDRPSVCFALLDSLAHYGAKICAGRQVLARENAAEYVIGDEPVRDVTFVSGCVP